MKNGKVIIISVLAVCLLAASYFIVNRKQKPVSFDPAFSLYISAFTTGNISKESTIRIRLNHELSQSLIDSLGTTNLFKFSPSIKGVTRWINNYSVEFTPENNLESGKMYQAEFLLGKILPVPQDLETFKFDFRVIVQSFDVQVDGMKAFDNSTLQWQRIYGSVLTADVEKIEAIEKVLIAHQGEKLLPIKWDVNADRKIFSFTIDSVVRAENASVVQLEWNGKAIGVELTGAKEIKVPSLGDFIVVDKKVFYEPEQYLLIQFSDPLLQNQNLEGLIRIGAVSELRYSITDNEIRVYAPQRLTGTYEITIEKGIQNIANFKLSNVLTFEITFEEIMPAVRLTSNGVVLPGNDKFMLPFEAVNLKAVDVRVLRISENNIQQFLQVNSLRGENELKRVGTIVAKKTVYLDEDKLLDLHRWNKFVLDLTDLVKTQPGSIYQVRIFFKKEYSLYVCNSEAPPLVNGDAEGEDEMYEDDEYYYTEGSTDGSDEPDDYNSYYYPKGYRWEQKDNPCHVSYFSSQRWVSQNILNSNLGLMAKRSADGNMVLFVNDLKTTKPLSQANVEIYDYQQQLLSKIKTNSEGIAKFNTSGKPYLFIAKYGNESGYLRLDDGTSLSLSKFDVAGEEVQAGIKGFIYGERGVWRPGDTLHLIFMLEDKQKLIPENHPVSFELFNPLGQLVVKNIRAEAKDGIYSFQTVTSGEAPTGNWNVKVKVGGATFQKTIRVETIIPNRLKIKLDFGDGIYVNKPVRGNLKVTWLHGAIAKKLKTKIDLTLIGGRTEFKSFPGFVFDDPFKKVEAETISAFDGEIDENGTAIINPNIEAQNAPGVLDAVLVTRVFEPGGESSIDKFSVPYYPYSRFIGIKLPQKEKGSESLLSDTNHLVKIVAVDQSGRPVRGEMEVEIQLYSIQWRWWWDRSEEDLTNYNTSRYTKLMKRESVKLKDGIGEYSLRVNYPDWGRFLLKVVDNKGGHSSGKAFYIDWSSQYANRERAQPDGVTSLNFTSDKQNYKVGEKVILDIPTGKVGKALVSIESGSRIIETHWVDVNEGRTQFVFTASKEMTPNVYVYVALLQPHSQTLNDLPIRMYGVIPIMIEDPATKLLPKISIKDVIRPETKSSITISEKSGKEMSYTIAVVDEGLLDLTRYKTPDPWNHFYAREALGVKTWDLYDDVIGAWNSKLERILSIGGDDYKRPTSDNKAKRFKPVVIFLGPFHLAMGETRTHEFFMPQYVGSVRAMVVAGHQGTYGQAEKTVAVRKPLMILASLPRVVGPGESVSLPVNIFAMERQIKNVTVEVQPNQFFSVEGDLRQNVEFSEIGDKTIDFRLKVKSALGIGKLKVVASSGTEKAQFDIEIDVRNPNPIITDVKDSIIEAGQKINLSYKPIGMQGTNKAVLEISSFPPINLNSRLEYLVQYPHGCIEQTTSAVFPQLFLGSFMDLSPERKSEIETNIKAGILRISTFQAADGGFSYWAGSNKGDEWGSNYAGHFLLEAQTVGYTIPPSLLDQWKRFQKQKANAWSYGAYEHTTLMQAYRLYTLALAKTPEFGAMNRLKEFGAISVEAKWCLAAAYQLAGQNDIAKNITAQIGTAVKSYKELSNTYGSDLRDKAMILEALALMGEKSKAAPLVKELAERLSSAEWLSTQTSAYCLVALAKFINKSSISKKLNYSYRLNSVNKEVASLTPFSQINLPIKGTSVGMVELENKSTGTLFVRVLLSGQPESGFSLPATDNHLKIDIVYRAIDGTVIDISKLKQGTDFIAEVNVFNPGTRSDYEQMALSQIFPSGWEIHNTRLYGSDDKWKSSLYVYQDVRDDRVYTYYNLKKNQKHTYYIFLNASYIGRYYLPSIYSEAMYDASINSRIPGKWVEVFK
ncbi:MAG TPA: MG2 domain-containing protein [Bacteroidia bacterium]|nr:MG2 domain-containing protein [Bacteroidia bacterium]